MLYALSSSKERIKAVRGLEGYCPDCGQILIPKCGMIKIHHWGHKNLSPDCKYDYHDMCEWHYKWQELAETFGYETEISFGKERRADTLGFNRVIEIQHSSISLEEIVKRSKFYRSKGFKIDWIFDMTERVKIPKSIEKYIIEYKIGRIFLDYGKQIEEFNPTKHSYKFRVQTHNDIFKPHKYKIEFISNYNCIYFDPLEDISRIVKLNEQIRKFKEQQKFEERSKIEKLRIERIKEIESNNIIKEIDYQYLQRINENIIEPIYQKYLQDLISADDECEITEFLQNHSNLTRNDVEMI